MKKRDRRCLLVYDPLQNLHVIISSAWIAKKPFLTRKIWPHNSWSLQNKSFRYQNKVNRRSCGRFLCIIKPAHWDFPKTPKRWCFPSIYHVSFKSLICFTFHHSNGNFVLSWMVQVHNDLLQATTAGPWRFLRSKLRCQALPTQSRSTYGETRFHVAETGPHGDGDFRTDSAGFFVWVTWVSRDFSCFQRDK